ncbi:HlyD family secretion protein [Dyella sp.]|uniref:HlyD family secretion protein n=1 Tax=Dyella sp. TaxID=1869338 RepID=UPI002D77D53A|nr:HlyD family efflux transporter periplasmic adaptor subunit [Dyella sp.]HET7332250.1 HlyD family efflux transporter periplasmic adaptor subunit [Dyella sp.]
MFRNEALEARRGEWLGSINLATPLSFVWLAVLGLTLAITLVSFLVFGHYTRRESVVGQLVPDTGVLAVNTPSSGHIARALVREGETVSAGQPLVEISGDLATLGMGNAHAVVSGELRDQEARLHATLADVEPQSEAQEKDLRTRIDMLRTQIAQIDAQLVLQHKQAASAQQLVEKIEPLRKSGIVSVFQFEQQQSVSLQQQAQVKTLARQRLDTEQQLSALRAQLAQLPLNTAAKVNDLRVKLSQLDASLAENEAERGTVLRAPRAGVVTTMLVKPGQAVSAGQTLLSIVPQGSQLQAQLLVPSSAIGFIEPGNRVVLRYQAYPYQKFGQRYGRVLQVSRSALSDDETASLLRQSVPTPLYRVLVELDRQSIDANGKLEPLKPGMALNADILLERRSLLEWAFAPLYGLREHLMAEHNG